MDRFKVQEILEICRELGISVGSTKWIHNKSSCFLMVEEAQEAKEAIQATKAPAQ